MKCSLSSASVMPYMSSAQEFHAFHCRIRRPMSLSSSAVGCNLFPNHAHHLRVYPIVFGVTASAYYVERRLYSYSCIAAVAKGRRDYVLSISSTSRFMHSSCPQHFDTLLCLGQPTSAYRFLVVHIFTHSNFHLFDQQVATPWACTPLGCLRLAAGDLVEALH